MSRPANVATGKCRDRQMSRPANVATGKCRDRQMSRPANVATGRISVGKCRDRQMSRPANVATGKCRDRQKSDRQKSDRRGVDRHLVDHHNQTAFRFTINTSAAFTTVYAADIAYIWSAKINLYNQFGLHDDGSFGNQPHQTANRRTIHGLHDGRTYNTAYNHPNHHCRFLGIWRPSSNQPKDAGNNLPNVVRCSNHGSRSISKRQPFYNNLQSSRLVLKPSFPPVVSCENHRLNFCCLLFIPLKG